MIKGMLREIYWRRTAEDGGDVVANLSALCPACGFEHSFRVDFEGHGQHGKVINAEMLHGQQEHHPVCHSFLRDGVWLFLSDCSHEMADSAHPMMISRRHGWHLFPWTDDEGKPIGESTNG